MDLKVGVDPDGELGRGGVCHAGHGCLLSLAGWGTARAPAGRTALRGVWATGSYQVTSVRLACRWWPRPGPTGQPQGTRPDDSRVRPWPRPPRGLGWRPRLGSTGQEQGTQPAESRVRPSPRPPPGSSQRNQHLPRHPAKRTADQDPADHRLGPGQPSQRPHRATNPRPLPHSPTLAPSQAWSAGPRLGRPATNCRTAASAARADGIVSSSAVGRPAVPTWSSWRTISSPKRLAAARGRQQWTGPAGRSKLDTGMMQQNGGAAETWTAWATAITAVARW